MSPLLRVDGYLLARAEKESWHSQWCVARRREGGGRWQFGTGTLLQSKRDGNENNSYLDSLESHDIGSGGSDLDLAYWHLQHFLSSADGEPLDVLASAALDMPRLERLMGVLAALGHRPRHVLPHALLSVWDWAQRKSAVSGIYRMVELGRSRTVVSRVQIENGHVLLEEDQTQEFDFGFQQVFARWFELAAQEFASKHRFDVHRNLASNREELFRQMCTAKFGPENHPLALVLESRAIALDVELLTIDWPEKLLESGGAECLLVSPLRQEMPLHSPGISHQGGISGTYPEVAISQARAVLESVAESSEPQLVTELRLN